MNKNEKESVFMGVVPTIGVNTSKDGYTVTRITNKGCELSKGSTTLFFSLKETENFFGV